MLLLIFSASMLIRVPTEEQLRRLNFPAVERRTEEGYEVLVDEYELSLKLSPFEYEVLIGDMDEYFREKALSYPSWTEVRDSIYYLANTYPEITKLDTIGPPTYEGRLILALKISDNPSVDEDEPEILFQGLHHAREWPSVVMTLFIMDTLLTGYTNNIPDIKSFVENLEIWVIPCVNPDGYKYSHDDGYDWRKNRRFFPSSSTYGVDPNRNYWGYPDTLAEGNWGTPNGASNNPSSSTYMGPSHLSESETKAVKELRSKHEFIASLSYHTYSELVLWPFGHTYNSAPDSDLLSWVGTEMANRILGQSGGTYTPEQSSDLYPTVGDETDFAYGYSLFNLGQMTLPYTIEMCETFAPSESYLPQVIHENFDAVYWLLSNAHSIEDSVKKRERVVLKIEELPDTVNPNFSVSWNYVSWNPEASRYILREFKDLSYVSDGAESNSNLWIQNGFSRTLLDYHSGSYSFYSDNYGGGVYTTLMRTKYPSPPPENFSYWVKYNITSDADFGYFEISNDGRFYYEVKDYVGNSNWSVENIDLRSFCDSVFKDSLEEIYYRFRLCTSYGSEIWIDDISNIGVFGFDSIVDTVMNDSYTFNSHPLGEYYLSVKGENSKGWGDWCNPVVFNVYSDNSPPGTPEIISLFDNASIYTLMPTISFVSEDTENEDLEYRLFYCLEPNFNNSDSVNIGIYPSGDTVSYTFTVELLDGETYFWRVKARDPAGSGYWGSFSYTMTFTVNTNLPEYTVSWYQQEGFQFKRDELDGLEVVGDSVMLTSGGMGRDTILNEGFEGSFPPLSWEVYRFGGSSHQWQKVSDYAYSGSYSAKVNYDGGSEVDTWLATDRLDLSSTSNCTLSFYQRGNWMGYYEYWGLLASTSSKSDTSSFIEVLEVGPGLEDAWEHKIVDLSQFAGHDTLYLAFRYKEYNGSDWWIDDVRVSIPKTNALDSGKIISTPIEYNDLESEFDRLGEGWGDIYWEKKSAADSIGIKLEYYINGNWLAVPDSVLSGNSNGFFSHMKIGTIQLNNLDTLMYDSLRMIGLIYAPVNKSSENPALLSWEIGNLENYTGIADGNDKSFTFFLYPVNPNPVFRNCEFKYSIHEESEVNLSIFDIAGRNIVNLVDKKQPPGLYSIKWDGKTKGGEYLSTGVYFYRLGADDDVTTRKLIFVR